jgi:hypothetical protein
MIKKLLVAASLLCGGMLIKAQTNNGIQPAGNLPVLKEWHPDKDLIAAKTSSASLYDTLDYFFNKHYFRNTASLSLSFPTFQSPYTNTAVILNEFGSSFLNPGNGTVTVYGAYIEASRQSNSTSSVIPCRVYIYSASPSGVPASRLDSGLAQVTTTLGSQVMANFTNPVVVTGAYFISFKPMPLVNTDTLRAFMTSARTATAPVAQNLKFGEGLGYVKINGTWGVTNQVITPLANGYDYEPVVTPIVSFNYAAGGTQMAPNGTGTNTGQYCANSPITFTNTTTQTSFVENRQYNWNKFMAVWGGAMSNTVTPPAADSIYNWFFSGPATPTAAYTSKNASHTYSSYANANTNLIVKYQKNTGTKVQDIKSFPTYTIANCGIINGLSQNVANADLSVYPNPVINGKTNVSGLQGVNTIEVFNLLGQKVSSQTTDKEIYTVDLSSQVPGTYMLKITDAYNNSKVLKVLNH